MGTDAATAQRPIDATFARGVARVVAVAAGYLLTGELSRFLAIPPGYASPVWPAAGLSLVAVVLAGNLGALGVVIGSFVLNLHIGLRTEAPVFPVGVTVALLIAIGAGAQAWVGVWLSRRLLGPGNPLEMGYSVPAFMLLAGPVACVVNGLWSPLWLLAFHQVAGGPSLLVDVVTWWVGDSIGVMLVAPLLLAWEARTYFQGARQWAGILVPLALGTAAVVLLFWQAQHASRLQQEAAFAERARLVAGAITQDLERAAAFSESIARAFGAPPAIDRDAFREMVAPWLAANPGIAAFEWVPYVPRADRATFEARSRDADFPDYRIERRATPPEPLAEADFYAPILYVEPMEQERAAVGYDLTSSPARLAALEESRDTGRAVGTAPIRLVTTPGEWGMLVTTAAYSGVGTPPTIEARRRQLLGFSTTVLRLDQLVRADMARMGDHALVVRLVEVTPNGEHVISGPPAGAVERDAARWSSQVNVAGRPLRIDVLTAGPAPRPWTGWTVLTVGLAGTGLLVAFVLDMRAQAVRVERMVAERTSALARANEALTLSNLDLQRFTYVAAHDMREPLRAITAYGELLDQEVGQQLDPACQVHLRRMVAATRRMQAMIAGLLAHVRVDQRVVPFHQCSLERPVRAALEDLSEEVAEAGATVRIGPLPTVRCDHVQMVQLFTNLLSNALKFRRPEVPLEIDIDSRATPSGFEVTVRDNGIGIDARHFDQIFEIFQRLPQERDYPGRGVGLAICRRIMERHCGRIWVESTPGEGSVFHVAFPRAPE